MADGETRVPQERIPVGVKIAYGSADFAATLFIVTYTVYFLIFLTDVAGVDPAVAGIVLFLSTIWSGVIDPAMGIISDRTRSRYGRRRPYIVGVAVPFCLLFWLLLTTPSWQGNALTAYFVVINTLLFLALTIFLVPYTAMAPEMTKDYDERTSLVGYRVVWAQVGAIVGSAAPLLIVQQFSDAKTGWSVTGAIFGGLCLIPILLTWRFTRGWERYAEDTEPLNLGEVLRATLGNRTFRYFAAIYLFSLAFLFGFDAAFVFFCRYHMEASEEEISLFFLILFASAVLWVPAITFVSNRIGKRGAFMLFMGATGIFNAVAVGLVQPRQIMLLYGIAVVLGSTMAAGIQLNLAMIPDVIEVDEFKTGKRREGLYNGAATLILKMGSALSILMVSQYLNWIGYEAGVAQSPEVILGMRIMQGPIWGGLIMIGVVIAFFMPMNRERHRALLKAIEAKTAGEPWDEEEIKELL